MFVHHTVISDSQNNDADDLIDDFMPENLGHDDRLLSDPLPMANEQGITADVSLQQPTKEKDEHESPAQQIFLQPASSSNVHREILSANEEPKLMGNFASFVINHNRKH